LPGPGDTPAAINVRLLTHQYAHGLTGTNVTDEELVKRHGL
tara:strand:- start:541 stop:663 length:123 start_codon:yes stop_codon:yes gene_type:complete